MLLEISSISDDDMLLHFILGLQLWVEQELWWQDSKDLSSAFTIVERLVDTSKRLKFDYKPFNAKENENNNNSSSNNKKKFRQQSQTTLLFKRMRIVMEVTMIAIKLSLFGPTKNCNRSHFAAKCPNIRNNQTTTSKHAKYTMQGEQNSEGPQWRALQLLNVMKK